MTVRQQGEVLDGFEAMLDLEDPEELSDEEKTAQLAAIATQYAEAKDRYDEAQRHADKLEEVVKTLESALVTQMQNANLRSFKVDKVGTFTHSTRLYPSITDDEAAMAWLTANGFEELIQTKVNLQRLGSVIKSQQENGGEMPLGVDFWEKQSCSLRRAR